jgi:cystathionine gamma-synthase
MGIDETGPTPDAVAPHTFIVSAGRPVREPDAPVNAPVVFSSTYVADGPTGYAREGNPTWDAYETVLGGLEGGRALVFGSGMGAVNAVLETVPAGGLVLAPEVGYSGTYVVLQQLADLGRIQLQRVELTDTPTWLSAASGASLIWLEVPSNPMLDVPDLPTISAAAHAAGALVAVDATLATAFNVRTLDIGADFAVHSATKLLSGHSDVLLGAVVVRSAELHAQIFRARTLGGAIAGPMEVFLGLRGMRTLAVRLRQVQRNALTIASRLVDHPAVSKVRYPGLHEPLPEWLNGGGGVLSFDAAAGADEAAELCRRTNIWLPSTSIGGIESQIERRKRYAAEPPGVPDELVRLSVGIEDVEDLWRDLDAALKG